MSWIEALTQASHARLLSPDGTDARAYLAGRGVTEEEIITFRLGYAAIPTEASPEFAIWAKKFWYGRLVFPLTSVLGAVIGVQTRALSEKQYQQFYSTHPHVHPYGFGIAQALPEIWRTHQVIVTEGVFDALAVWKTAQNVIATLSAHPTKGMTRFLGRYAVRVIALYDMDDVGRRGAQRLQQWWAEEFQTVAPEYGAHDPADLLAVGRHRELAAITHYARDPLPW